MSNQRERITSLMRIAVRSNSHETNAPSPACRIGTGLLSKGPDASADEAKAGTPGGVPELRSRLDASLQALAGGI